MEKLDTEEKKVNDEGIKNEIEAETNTVDGAETKIAEKVENNGVKELATNNVEEVAPITANKKVESEENTNANGDKTGNIAGANLTQETTEKNKANSNAESENTNSNVKPENSNSEKSKSVLSTVGNIISKIILIALAIIAIITMVRAIVYQKYDFLGFRFYQILSGSMEPIIHVRDVAIIKDSDDIHVNDIVAYQSGGSIVVHRIIKEYTEDVEGSIEPKKLYQTQGDNNNAPDVGLVQPSQIQGKLVGKIPKLGYVVAFVQSHLLIVLSCIGVLVFIILVRRLI